VPLEGTNNRRDYVNIAINRGLPLVLFVQAFEKVGSRSQVEEEVHGERETIMEDTTDEGSEAIHESIEGISEEGQEGGGAYPPHEATGEVDEGEVNPEIVKHFERENEDHNNAMDDDSSGDEEEHPIPHDWSSYDFSNLSMHEQEAILWEYWENEVCLGALYRIDVKEAVRCWSTLSLQRRFRVVKSSPHVYEVCYVQSNCPFRVHAYKGK
jgi:hypothetical protein